MKTFRRALHSVSLALLFSVALVGTAMAAPAAAPATATDIANHLRSVQQDGASYVRLRLEVEKPGAPKIALQLQIKQRRTRGGIEMVYHVLWPKERKGEAVLLRKTSSQPGTGIQFIPPNNVTPLDRADMKQSLFGSGLSYDDVLENFFAWDKQEIVGTETVDRVVCQILESKPGKGDRSTYGSVRSWVDVRRMVPLRVEKFNASGQRMLRIDTTKVANDDNNHALPATIVIQSANGARTELEGSKIRHDVRYTDQDFTADALKTITGPRSGE